MKAILSLMELLLAFLFVTCVQPVSASQSKHETIKKAVLYQSLIVQQDNSIVVVCRNSCSESLHGAYCLDDVSNCIVQDYDSRQSSKLYRNLCVFDLPDRPASLYRDDRTVINSNRQYLYLRLHKVLAIFEPVTVSRSTPLLC